MTTQLDQQPVPPPVPPLSTDQRNRLRRQVMERTAPATGSTRRWIAPAIAVGAVAAVVAGTLAITHQRTDPQVAGVPAATTVSGLKVVPDAEAAAAFKNTCLAPGKKLKDPIKVLWARRVPGRTLASTNILMLVKGSSELGASGVEACLTAGTRRGEVSAAGVPWNQPPTRKQGLRALSGGRYSTQTPAPQSQLWTLYQASPEIARIESRFVWKGGKGPWQPGYVDSGFAYTDSRSNTFVPVTGSQHEEVRAYDAQGRLIPIAPK
ncbi:hypothetical protein GCM10009804_45910 [Kribbella hippodromi]|uniref:Uncharacterized protein n=1 Tax=Kribbella hippodromi TaxID=434347 RepID=A0ABP4PNN9_9ACTN